MTTPPDVDLKLVHRYFAAQCYNEAWQLMDREDRDAADDLRMVAAAYASVYHWEHRDDVSDEKRSVGLWQLARIFALLGDGASARQAALRGLDLQGPMEPFYKGYLYEGLARAEAILGESAAAREALEKANHLADAVTEAEDRQMLKADLEQVAAILAPPRT